MGSQNRGGGVVESFIFRNSIRFGEPAQINKSPTSALLENEASLASNVIRLLIAFITRKDLANAVSAQAYCIHIPMSIC